MLLSSLIFVSQFFDASASIYYSEEKRMNFTG